MLLFGANMRCWVRTPADSYNEATRGDEAKALGDIDVSVTLKQHAAYVEGMKWLGFTVRELPKHSSPDSCFVEDPAVLGPGRALILRSAHSVRATEAESVREALKTDGLEIVEMEAPATLDGGDVLRLGKRYFVSQSGRTNAAGIAALAAAFPSYEVVELPLPEGVLHLKCACSRADDDVVVITQGCFDPAVFAPHRVVSIPREELYAANIVGHGGRVLCAAGYPGTEAALKAAGLEVRLLDTVEFHKGDGSLTCLSLREVMVA